MSYHDISPEEAAGLLEKDGLIVLDMRDPARRADGALPGAQPASDAVVQGIMRQRRANPAVLVYCYHGNASRDLCALLSQFGLSEVYNLTGGWAAWQARTVAPPPPSPSPLPTPSPHAEWYGAHGYEDQDFIANVEKNNMTPLMMAALEGNHPVIDTLIAAGADVNGRNPDGLHALWFACVSGDVSAVRKLIAHGGDLNNQNVNGFTCAMYAASAGRLEVLQALVEGGADLSVRSPDGMGALESAATVAVLRYLRPLVAEAVPA